MQNMIADPGNPAPDQKNLKVAITLAMVIFGLGLCLSLSVWQSGLASLDLYGNSFHVLYVRNETGGIAAAFLALWLARPVSFAGSECFRPGRLPSTGTGWPNFPGCG